MAGRVDELQRRPAEIHNLPVRDHLTNDGAGERFLDVGLLLAGRGHYAPRCIGQHPGASRVVYVPVGHHDGRHRRPSSIVPVHLQGVDVGLYVVPGVDEDRSLVARNEIYDVVALPDRNPENAGRYLSVHLSPRPPSGSPTRPAAAPCSAGAARRPPGTPP